MLIIDRIEEDIAVLECSDPAEGTVYTQNMPLAWLPADVREGDVLRKTKNGYVIDEAETQKRRAEAAALLNSLRQE